MGQTTSIITNPPQQIISPTPMDLNKQIAINCYLHHGFAEDGKYLFALIDNYKLTHDDFCKYNTGSLPRRKMMFAQNAQHTKNKYSHVVCNYEINDLVVMQNVVFDYRRINFCNSFFLNIIFYCLRKYGYRRINHMKHYCNIKLDYYEHYLWLCEREPVYAIFSNYGGIQKGLRKIIQTKGSAMSLMCFQRIATILFLIGEQTWLAECVVNPFVLLFCNDYLLHEICKFL